ncbi:MAG: hypothetical protein OJF62_002075 [Pseudolabrys sp.]|jgi:hypothetical protein|nr:hypothetical protein [Pseudolabrys sp.]
MKSKKQKTAQLRVTAGLMSGLPDAEIIDRLFGGPALLPGEDRLLYDQLMRRVRETVQPVDIIDHLLIDDAVNWGWEVLRLRRIRLDLYAKLEKWQDDQFANAEFRQVVRNIATIERRIAMAEDRRDRALHEIERRHGLRAARLQQMIEQPADGPSRAIALYTPQAKIDLLRAQLVAVAGALQAAKAEAGSAGDVVEEAPPEEVDEAAEGAATELAEDEASLVPQETPEGEESELSAVDDSDEASDTPDEPDDEACDDSDETA